MHFLVPPAETRNWGWEWKGVSTRRFLDSIDWSQSEYVQGLVASGYQFFDVRVSVLLKENLCESAHMRGLNEYERWLYENMRGIVGIFDDRPKSPYDLGRIERFFRTYRFECHVTGMMFRLRWGVRHEPFDIL